MFAMEYTMRLEGTYGMHGIQNEPMQNIEYTPCYME